MPVVSVLMSVYNGQKFLDEAIRSVLNQSFADFEFLIVDDGSTDSSVSIVEKYSDPRIKILKNEKNLGLIVSLNKLINASTGKYLARLDCDDVAHPERFKLQVEAMECDKTLVLLGTNCRFINEDSRVIYGGRTYFSGEFDYPDTFVRWLLFFPENPFVHSSVMIRRETLLHSGLLYSPDARHVEDFDLWTKLCFFGKMKILKQPLVDFRLVSSSITSKNNAWQIERSKAIALSFRRRFLGQASDNSLKEASEVGILELRQLYKVVASIGTDEEAFDDLMRRDFCGRLVKKMIAGILRNPSLLREVLFVVKNTEGIGFAGLLQALLAKMQQKMNYLLSEKRQYS
ncbi:MAG TPA: glycosyltransferase [Candidatus Rifleibacterium sp.]|nr:glycosyltransferase [Candidatus Rifleibacterium sp.]